MNNKLIYIFVFLIASLFIISACESLKEEVVGGGGWCKYGYIDNVGIEHVQTTEGCPEGGICQAEFSGWAFLDSFSCGVPGDGKGDDGQEGSERNLDCKVMCSYIDENGDYQQMEFKATPYSTFKDINRNFAYWMKTNMGYRPYFTSCSFHLHNFPKSVDSNFRDKTIEKNVDQILDFFKNNPHFEEMDTSYKLNKMNDYNMEQRGFNLNMLEIIAKDLNSGDTNRIKRAQDIIKMYATTLVENNYVEGMVFDEDCKYLIESKSQ